MKNNILNFYIKINNILYMLGYFYINKHITINNLEYIILDLNNIELSNDIYLKLLDKCNLIGYDNYKNIYLYDIYDLELNKINNYLTIFINNKVKLN